MKEIAFGELGLAAKKEKKSNIIKWTETAGIEYAGKLKIELQKAIDENPLVFIDLSGLEDIDLTGIQLILAAKKEADGILTADPALSSTEHALIKREVQKLFTNIN